LHFHEHLSLCHILAANQSWLLVALKNLNNHSCDWGLNSALSHIGALSCKTLINLTCPIHENGNLEQINALTLTDDCPLYSLCSHPVGLSQSLFPLVKLLIAGFSCRIYRTNVCQSVAAVAATCVHDILQSCASRRIPCNTKVQAQKFQMLLGFLQMFWRLLTVAQLLNETISCWIRYMGQRDHD
jgi:hypothetical protein